MFVYLLLPFVYHIVPLLANPISIRHLYGGSVKIIFRQEEADVGSPQGGNIWEWNAIDGGKYLPEEETTPFPENAEGVGEGLSSLEISKSVELVFDPKSEAFIPVMEVSRSNQTERDSHRNSILLLSSHTRKSLHKIFEKFEKEAKGSAITGAKNYQTGRFKLHFRKRGGF